MENKSGEITNEQIKKEAMMNANIKQRHFEVYGHWL